MEEAYRPWREGSIMISKSMLMRLASMPWGRRLDQERVRKQVEVDSHHEEHAGAYLSELIKYTLTLECMLSRGGGVSS